MSEYDLVIKRTNAAKTDNQELNRELSMDEELMLANITENWKRRRRLILERVQEKIVTAAEILAARFIEDVNLYKKISYAYEMWQSDWMEPNENPFVIYEEMNRDCQNEINTIAQRLPLIFQHFMTRTIFSPPQENGVDLVNLYLYMEKRFKQVFIEKVSKKFEKKLIKCNFLDFDQPVSHDLGGEYFFYIRLYDL